MLFGVRTTIGQEKNVAENLEKRAGRQKAPILAFAVIDNMRGYVLIESEDEAEVRKLAFRAPHVRGIIKSSMNVSEIAHFFETTKITGDIERGDIVELTSGAFKGEKARVLRVDESKDKITVEIIEAAVPIPLKVSSSAVRVLQKANA